MSIHHLYSTHNSERAFLRPGAWPQGNCDPPAVELHDPNPRSLTYDEALFAAFIIVFAVGFVLGASI